MNGSAKVIPSSRTAQSQVGTPSSRTNKRASFWYLWSQKHEDPWLLTLELPPQLFEKSWLWCNSGLFLTKYFTSCWNATCWMAQSEEHHTCRCTTTTQLPCLLWGSLILLALVESFRSTWLWGWMNCDLEILRWYSPVPSFLEFTLEFTWSWHWSAMGWYDPQKERLEILTSRKLLQSQYCKVNHCRLSASSLTYMICEFSNF